MKIAVIVDYEGRTSGFERDGFLKVFSNTDGFWKEIGILEYKVSLITNAAMLHRAINEISEWMQDCKIIVVNRIRGIHYIAFEEHQISMLENKGNPDEFLELICECMVHQRTGTRIPMEHNAIYEKRQGMFYTDLQEVMKGNTSYNSKQLLYPFIKRRQFTALEIICDHVPKWLEREAADLEVILTVENYRDCLKVLVLPGKFN